MFKRCPAKKDSFSDRFIDLTTEDDDDRPLKRRKVELDETEESNEIEEYETSSHFDILPSDVLVYLLMNFFEKCERVQITAAMAMISKRCKKIADGVFLSSIDDAWEASFNDGTLARFGILSRPTALDLSGNKNFNPNVLSLFTSLTDLDVRETRADLRHVLGLTDLRTLRYGNPEMENYKSEAMYRSDKFEKLHLAGSKGIYAQIYLKNGHLDKYYNPIKETPTPTPSAETDRLTKNGSFERDLVRVFENLTELEGPSGMLNYLHFTTTNLTSLTLYNYDGTKLKSNKRGLYPTFENLKFLSTGAHCEKFPAEWQTAASLRNLTSYSKSSSSGGVYRFSSIKPENKPRVEDLERLDFYHDFVSDDSNHKPEFERRSFRILEKTVNLKSLNMEFLSWDGRTPSLLSGLTKLESLFVEYGERWNYVQMIETVARKSPPSLKTLSFKIAEGDLRTPCYSLPDSVLDLENLTALDVMNHPGTCVCASALKKLTRLVALKMKTFENGTDDLETICMPNLTHLELGRQRIGFGKRDSAFMKAPNLKHLCASEASVRGFGCNEGLTDLISLKVMDWFGTDVCRRLEKNRFSARYVYCNILEFEQNGKSLKTKSVLICSDVLWRKKFDFFFCR